MKKSKCSLAVVALTASPQLIGADNSIAALTAEIKIKNGWLQLLPAGAFKAVDGRPFDVESGQWFIDKIVFEAMMQNTPHQETDLVLDYEHQTLNSPKNGNPAPAAGYFNLTEIEWREGQGVFIKPRLTPKATDFIEGKEYRYLSCVFAYDKITGHPSYIHSAALTNRPAVDGMEPLAELSALMGQAVKQQATTPLKRLFNKLGVKFEGTQAEVTDKHISDALLILDDLMTEKELPVETTALSAKTIETSVDLSKFVPVETYNSLLVELSTLDNQLSALTYETNEEEITRVINQGFNYGQVFASDKKELAEFGRQHGVAALTASIQSRRKIPALLATQTGGIPPHSERTVLTSAENAAAKMLGMSENDYINIKKENK